ncbi:hypothetical protein B0H14DRAFT_3002011 [Mycena olivaceomarginata]|nr:hypothetical protein B0H14DRAFT_3002011 [Mycena olivaceomarginata]
MLAMPLAWITWGVIYFVIFMLAFFWRSGGSDEPSDNSKPSPIKEYGPRAITTLMIIFGGVYVVLTIMTVRGIGSRHNAYIELRAQRSG